MIRITPLQEDDAVARLLVEGQLTQQTIEELKVLCDACLTHYSTLLLEVSGVKFVDAAGLDTLRSLKRKGAVLIGCSGFLTEMLQVNPAGERPSTSTTFLVLSATSDVGCSGGMNTLFSLFVRLVGRTVR